MYVHFFSIQLLLLLLSCVLLLFHSQDEERFQSVCEGLKLSTLQEVAPSLNTLHTEVSLYILCF